MNTNMILTEPLILEWLEYMQEVNIEHERMIRAGSEFCIPFMASPTPVVKKLFVIVESFGLGPKTKYLALYIYEKYVSNQFWEVYKEHETRPNSEEYKRAIAKVSKVLMIRLMSCIQLASKMDSHTMALGITQVLSALARLEPEYEYTRGAVALSEIKVFKIIHFKIPLVTPVDCIEILLAALKLEKMPKVYTAAIHVLDMTYLQHQQLFSQLQVMSHCSVAKTKEDKINCMVTESDIVLLSAAVISCTIEIFHLKVIVRNTVAERLEELVKIDRNDIVTLGKMIFAILDLASVSHV